MLGWLVATASAVAVAMATLNAVGVGILGGNHPISERAVQVQLSQAGTPSAAAPTPSGTESVGGEKYLSSEGGTVLARCEGPLVRIVSWSPAAGYRGDDEDQTRGPAGTALVTFKAGRHEVKMLVTCVGGTPTAQVTTEH